MVKVLVGGGADINSTNKIGQTPLIYASIEQKVGVARLLLQVIGLKRSVLVATYLLTLLYNMKIAPKRSE